MGTTVICGVNEIEKDWLVGKSVEQLRRQLQQPLNVDPRAIATVNGNRVGASYILRKGDTLEFVHPSGRKAYSLEKADRSPRRQPIHGVGDRNRLSAGETDFAQNAQTQSLQASYVVLYEAAEEGGFVALVPALPGCYSQGETLEEASDNIQEAIEVYLESLIAHGESIPREARVFQGIVTVSLPVQS